MLKKPAIFFLVALYIITATGFSLNLHYCLGQLASVRLDAPAKECAKKHQTKGKKCCKDKHFEVRVKDAHQNAAYLFSGKTFAVVLLKPSLRDFTTITEEASLSQSAYRGPPLSPVVSTYLMNCSFRI